jgi:hypothetical protein
MGLAPIALFVYNRPWHTRQALEALAENRLANQSELFVFSDGPKENAPIGTLIKIEEVRNIIREKQWCGNVKIIESKHNKGLADSIIDGVTQIVNQYGKIIVLEDDIITSKFFVDFMNNALDVFEYQKKVMHITGHSFPLKGIKQDIYFLNYVSPWGWGTWIDRWKFFEKDASLLLSKLHKFPDFNSENYNCGFGNEFYEQLIRNSDSRLKTWAVKWHTSIFLEGGICLFPQKSLVLNIGFDNSGENCGNVKPYFAKINNKYMPILSDIRIEINEKALNSFKNYYKTKFLQNNKKNLIVRIYGRLQSILMGRKKPGTNKA